MRSRIPAVISTQKGLNEPRYATLKGIMSAKKKPLEELEVEIATPATRVESLSKPPERPAGRILGEGVAGVASLVDALKTEAKVL